MRWRAAKGGGVYGRRERTGRLLPSGAILCLDRKQLQRGTGAFGVLDCGCPETQSSETSLYEVRVFPEHASLICALCDVGSCLSYALVPLIYMSGVKNQR